MNKKGFPERFRLQEGEVGFMWARFIVKESGRDSIPLMKWTYVGDSWFFFPISPMLKVVQRSVSESNFCN
jgi:hypothetical protein